MTTTEKKVYAYLRKSTKKAQQEQSIEKQKNAITQYADSIGIDKNNIEYFIDEGYSGFNGITHTGKNKYTRQRKEFTKLLNIISKSKELSTILVFDYSRLTRNIEDYTEISKLLGINNKNGLKIEGIHFISDGAIWNKYTRQGDMITAVLDSLKYSEKISANITNSRILKLKDGIFPNDIKIPKGIERGEKYLKVSKDMKFIIEAFKMKSEGISNKDIIEYLKKNNIIISLSHIADRLWKNRLYIGEYTLKSNGEVYKIRFYKNEIPVKISLFNQSNDNIGFKKGKYGNNQKNDLLANLLKTEKGNKFTGYTPKDREARQYLNDREKIYISQNKIFNEYEEIIKRICYLQYSIFKENFYSLDDRMLGELEQIFEKKGFKFTEELKNSFLKGQIESNKSINLENIKYEDFDLFMLNKSLYGNHYYLKKIIENIEEIRKISTKDYEKQLDILIKDFGIKKEDKEGFIIIMEYYINIYKKSYKQIKELIVNNGNKQFKIIEEENLDYLKTLEKEKKLLENKVEQAKSNAIMQGYSIEDLNIAIKKPLDDINTLDKEIKELNNNFLNDKDLDIFISAIEEIFEHTSNMLGEANTKVKKEKYLHLIKMITFELVLSTKKELRIKLFSGIDKLLFAYGNPTENGTPVTALRRPGPNH